MREQQTTHQLARGVLGGLVSAVLPRELPRVNQKERVGEPFFQLQEML